MSQEEASNRPLEKRDRPSPQQLEGGALKLAKRLAKLNIKCLSSYEETIPYGTLERDEFKVAIHKGWIRHQDKKYYFTKEAIEEIKGLGKEPVRQSAVEVDKLITEPVGEFQVKITNIIFRGTSKLQYPILDIVGIDGMGKERIIRNGIPHLIAVALCGQAAKFKGKVIEIDEKENFVGLPLIKKEIPIEHLGPA